MSQVLETRAEKLAMGASDFPAFSGFSLARLKTNLSEALSHFGRLGIFEEYTKHDISHVNGMLRVYDWLIPNDTAERMSPADWLLAVLGAYLHDFGLLVTRKEFENRHSTEFSSYRENFAHSIANTRTLEQYLDSMPSARKEEFFYQEFVRYNHARRVKGWITGHPDPKLGFDPAVVGRFDTLLEPLESTFRSDLALVCESHHLNDLDDTKKYPVDRPYGDSFEETANVQYAAIVLRSADLLHISRDRSPAVAFEVINPANPVSQAEWSKQNAVRRVRPQRGKDADGNFSDDVLTETIEVFATFKSAEGFFGLTSYLQYAESQLAECYAWAKESNRKYATPHMFPWRRIDSTEVEASGFIASPFEFQIDQHRILDLLTGHTLYNDTNIALRELVQNSIDAVRLWEEEQGSGIAYTPTVHIKWDSREKILLVTDNGTGMSQDVIESNFLRVGSSRYQEAKFVKHYPNFSSISRFGIGVLSAFMIGDDIDVYTVSTEEDQARHLTLRSVHGKYLIRLLDKSDPEIAPEIRQHGTQIVLRVRGDAELKNVLQTLEHWIVVPKCHVIASIDDDPPKRIGFESAAEALKEILITRKIASVVTEAPECLHSRTKEPIEIRVIESAGVSLAYAVEWTPWFSQWKFIPIERNSRSDSEPPVLGTCVEGIRVTDSTPGYANSVFYALANARGKSAPKTNVARNGLERTAEYIQYSKNAYAAYAAHINREIQEMCSRRGFSITKAANEAGHLCRALMADQFLDGYKGPEYSLLLHDALSSISTYLIERNGIRESLSLDELSDLSYVYTVESSLARHLEYVLSAVPKSISRANILASVEGGDSAPPLAPMYCSASTWDTFADRFLASWQPSEIEIDANQKSIVAKWVQTKTPPDWVREKADSPRRRGQSVFLPTASWSVQLKGTEDYKGVRLRNRSFLFINHPMLEFARKHAYSDEYIIGVVMSLLRMSPEQHVSNPRQVIELELDRYRAHLANSADLSGVTSKEIIDLVLSWEDNIFDIDRWERKGAFGAY